MQCISVFTSTVGLVLLSLATQAAHANIVRIDIEGQRVRVEVDEPDGPSDGSDSEDDMESLFDPILRLNRFTFQQTILDEHDDEIKDWIVLFCPKWFEPCEEVEAVYRGLAEKWTRELNDSLFTTHVRFAGVDCATEKALCNTQNVDIYPFVAHYHRRKQVQVFRANGRESPASHFKRFTDWLQQELTPPAPTAMAGVKSTGLEITAVQGRRIAALLIFAAIACNMWFMIWRGGLNADASSAAEVSQKTYRRPAEQSSDTSSLRARACCASVRALPQEWAFERPSLEL